MSFSLVTSAALADGRLSAAREIVVDRPPATVWKLLGGRATAVYVAVLALCAIGFGLLVQELVPAGWTPPGARVVDQHAHGAEGLPWTVHAQAVALLAVMAWAKWGPRKPGGGGH